jgi:hypothetical protein
MSGNNHILNCPKCGNRNDVRGKALTVAITCKSCRVYFRAGDWNKATVEFLQEEPQAIPLGARGRFDKWVYEVMGFTVKQESKYKYKWREYLLFNPFRGYAFLSEYNGHWNFIWPIESDPRNHSSESEFGYQDRRYNLYQKYTAQVVYATGEFFFDVVDMTSSTVNYEYISPPHMFALELSDDSVLWCEGEYFTRREIAEAFAIKKDLLPGKTGIGYTQPFDKSFSDQALISFSVLMVLLTLVIQLLINNSAEDKVVFQAKYTRADLTDQKVLVTPPFTLEAGPKNLEVLVYAPINNDWFFSEFTLICETDATEYNFTKEVEYYSGYEDGSSWSEGSQSGEAFLSQIPAGRYHLNIYPEFSFINQNFSILVRHDVPMTSNFFITCFGFLVFPLVYFLRRRHREEKRWRDSDYSPYTSE